MKTSLQLAIGFVVVFALGAVLGFVTRGGETPQDVTAITDFEEPETDTADELAQLRADLKSAAGRENELRRQLREAMRGSEKSKTKRRSKGKTSTTAIGRRVQLTTPDEADALFDEFIGRSDLEGLWELGAALLQLGQPGYDKMIALFGLLEERKREFGAAINMLWRNEELFLGRFLARFSDNSEEVLRFMLYAHNLEGELPDPLEDMEREMLDEMGPMLLGFYRGNDRALLNGYVDWMTAHVRDNPTKSRNDAFRALAQIRTPEAHAALVELVAEVPENRLREVVQALAWQRGPQAITTLEQLQEDVPAEGKLADVIQAALLYLRN
ncbi:MAG: hypothetical protein AAF581_22475 [Planctomycetota bacterium]